MAIPYPDHPQLRGNFAPLRMECDIENVIVQGEIPADLDITYYRNGPDPQFAPRGHHHWFAGDGMVHMFNISDGKIGYRNRWARTKKFQVEREAGRSLFGAFNPMENDESVAGFEGDGVANTNIVWHGDKLLALEEGHAPFAMDPTTLASEGAWDYQGRLQGPMTAHPKIDPNTGDMLFFGYMADGPFSKTVSYHEVNAKGELTRAERFEAPFASMMHDFITTENYVIFPVFPLTGSMERAMSGAPAFAWEPDKGSHLGVMPRNGTVADIRWFETDPCFVFHPMNAYEQDNKIIAHVMQFEEAPLFPHVDGSKADPEKANARLCEWQIDLADNSRGMSARYLDDITGEFPRLDERFTGQAYRHGFYGGSTKNNGGAGFDSIVHHDFQKGDKQMHVLAEGDFTGEPVFVPASTTAVEGVGYLLSVVYRGVENRSDLIVLDAQNVDQGPIATATLPHRVPFGFHGNWRYNGAS